MKRRQPVPQRMLNFFLDTLDFSQPVAAHHRRAQALERWGDQLDTIGAWPVGGPAVAVIGTRQPSEAQRQFAHDCAARLAQAGAVVVSGGALGVDAEALRGALQAGGKVVAVLPRQPGLPYPAGHAALYQQVAAQGGCLIGLRLPEGPLQRWAFVKRNQLLVELVDAVAVVACGAPSGTLAAATAALRAGLTVRARRWPQGVDASAGTEMLAAAGMAELPPVDELEPWLQSLSFHEASHSAAVLARLRPALAALRSAPAQAEPPRRRRAAHDSGPVDGEARGWQSYAGPQAAGFPAAQPSPAPLHGQEALLWASLAEFGSTGATLEPLAHAAGLPRGEAAALLLTLALHGRVRQGKEGSYVAQ